MNLIAVDIGNSRVTSAQFINGELGKVWHHPTDQALAAAQDICLVPDVSLVAISSVVPNATVVMVDYLRSKQIPIHEIDTSKQTILSGIYPSMGADRVATAIAAWKLYAQQSAVSVIDVGTATTLAVVSATGEFLGGYITLGLGSTLSALHKGAAQLPEVSMANFETLSLWPAHNTPQAMAAGTLSGHLGLIRQWLETADAMAGAKSKKILTGGWAKVIAVQSTLFDSVDQTLVLKGIYFMAAEAAGLKDQG